MREKSASRVSVRYIWFSTMLYNVHNLAHLTQNSENIYTGCSMEATNYSAFGSQNVSAFKFKFNEKHLEIFSP